MFLDKPELLEKFKLIEEEPDTYQLRAQRLALYLADLGNRIRGKQ